MSGARDRPSVRVTLEEAEFAPVYQERRWSIVAETPAPPQVGDYLFLSERKHHRTHWPRSRWRMVESVEPVPERGKLFWRIRFRRMTAEESA